MNTTELLQLHSELCTSAHALMKKKNHDYAGSSGDTPFANVTRVESMGITTTELGFMVRLTDKMSRLSTLMNGNKPKVEDEKIEDTILDVINYSVLLYAFLKSHGKLTDNP